VRDVTCKVSIGHQYLKIITERFKSVKKLGEKAIEQLSESDIHWTFNEESNSVAVIVKHLNGNMVSRWTEFLTSDGEKESRNREQEFTNDIPSKAELLHIWDEGWKEVFASLTNLKEDDLLKEVKIRGERHVVIDAIERQLAHYSYHIGQIVYIGKQLKNEKWQSLSIPKGNSENYLRKMLKKHNK
jgi:hypothetical protein